MAVSLVGVCRHKAAKEELPEIKRRKLADNIKVDLRYLRVAVCCGSG
jgi:hypothetical protein